MPRIPVVIPAYNEERSIGPLLAELRAAVPEALPIVVSDGSADRSAEVARDAGAIVLDLPCNLGVGGAVQAGMRHAWDLGYRTVARIDGDGQHPPAQIPALLGALKRTGADLVIGSRYLGPPRGVLGSTFLRTLGNRLLARFLSRICRCRITDPTSGFWCVRGGLLEYFAHDYPCEYPEPEAIALARRQGYEVVETPVTIRPRAFGTSSIRAIGTLFFALRVGLALVADRVRPIDTRFAKHRSRA